MDTITAFGAHAGKVWTCLREGPKTLTQIQKTANLTAREASVGLGWLAREGKIAISGEGLHQRFSLLEG
jgi:hypothetical protein